MRTGPLLARLKFLLVTPFDAGDHVFRVATTVGPTEEGHELGGSHRREPLCGSIGLLATAFARAAGAEVHVAGLDVGREGLAKSFGATRYWTADQPPAGTYDTVIDATTDEAVPALALRHAEPGGQVVFIGLSRKASLIDTRQVALNDLTVTGIPGASAGLSAAQ
jgi:Zn-dependent alcohol dehydrogenase